MHSRTATIHQFPKTERAPKKINTKKIGLIATAALGIGSALWAVNSTESQANKAAIENLGDLRPSQEVIRLYKGVHLREAPVVTGGEDDNTVKILKEKEVVVVNNPLEGTNPNNETWVAAFLPNRQDPVFVNRSALMQQEARTHEQLIEVQPSHTAVPNQVFELEQPFYNNVRLGEAVVQNKN